MHASEDVRVYVWCNMHVCVHIYAFIAQMVSFADTVIYLFTFEPLPNRIQSVAAETVLNTHALMQFTLQLAQQIYSVMTMQARCISRAHGDKSPVYTRRGSPLALSCSSLDQTTVSVIRKFPYRISFTIVERSSNDRCGIVAASLQNRT